MDINNAEQKALIATRATARWRTEAKAKKTTVIATTTATETNRKNRNTVTAIRISLICLHSDVIKGEQKRSTERK